MNENKTIVYFIKGNLIHMLLYKIQNVLFFYIYEVNEGGVWRVTHRKNQFLAAVRNIKRDVCNMMIMMGYL